jgi:hypothetical protein
MFANHDCFSRQIRNRLKTMSMGLGLVRLLQDAGRTEDARTTLVSLDPTFQLVAQDSNKPRRKPGKTSRSKRVSGRFSFLAG